MTRMLLIDEKFLETCATGTLIGTLLEQGDLQEVTDVTLLFPQTSLKTRQKNGGPKTLLMLEYVIPCLVQDVLTLIARGIKVEIATPVEE